MLGIAGSSLSAVTNVDAGQKLARNYQTPNVLYMMLGAAIFLIHNRSLARTLYYNLLIFR